MRSLLAVSIIILLFSCNRKKKLPEGILEPQKMQSVFWDYIRADVYAKDFIKKDSVRNDTIENIKLQNKVFSFYNISRNDFYKSYNYYTSHPDLMNALMDSILAKQNRLRLKSQSKANRNRIMPDDRRKTMPVIKSKSIPEEKKTIIPGKKAIRED